MPVFSSQAERAWRAVQRPFRAASRYWRRFLAALCSALQRLSSRLTSESMFLLSALGETLQYELWSRGVWGEI